MKHGICLPAIPPLILQAIVVKNASDPVSLIELLQNDPRMPPRQAALNRNEFNARNTAPPNQVKSYWPTGKGKQVPITAEPASSNDEDDGIRFDGISDADKITGEGGDRDMPTDVPSKLTFTAQACAIVIEETVPVGVVVSNSVQGVNHLYAKVPPKEALPIVTKQSDRDCTTSQRKNVKVKKLKARIRITHLPSTYKQHFSGVFSYLLIQNAGISEALAHIQESKLQELWKIVTGKELEKGSELIPMIRSHNSGVSLPKALSQLSNDDSSRPHIGIMSLFLTQLPKLTWSPSFLERRIRIDLSIMPSTGMRLKLMGREKRQLFAKVQWSPI